MIVDIKKTETEKNCQIISKMASREDWCAEKLSKLAIEDSKITALNEIKDHLSLLPHEDVIEIVKLLNLSLIFDCLNDSDRDNVDLVCHVLTMCLNALNPKESIKKYSVQLERAIHHPFINVKLMVLKELERIIKDETVLLDLIKRTSLLSALIQCIGEEELSVAKKASDIVTIIGKHPPGAKAIVSPEILSVIRDVMGKNEVVRLRVYEVIVNMCKESDETFNILKPTGLLTQIIGEAGSNDVLFKMNIIEILAQLGFSKHGYNFLESHNMIEQQMRHFEEASTDPMILELCEPGLLRFFGHIAYWKPAKILSKYPKIVDHIFANLESENLIILGVTYDIIGHIASTNDGKFALAVTGNKIEKGISTIAKTVHSLPTEIKVRALSCLENLLKVVDFNSDVTNLTKHWYTCIDDTPMNFILKYARNPFFELRLSGFALLQAIAEQQWGQIEIRDTPGLIEFLMDRKLENKRECKEAKYNICKVLETSSEFDFITKEKLKQFVKEGPFFVETLTEVAIEGNE